MVDKFENIDDLNKHFYNLLIDLSINSQYFSDKITKQVESNIFKAYENSYKILTINDKFLTKYDVKEVKYKRKDFIFSFKLAKKKFRKELRLKRKIERRKLNAFLKKHKKEIRSKVRAERKEKFKQFFNRFKRKKKNERN